MGLVTEDAVRALASFKGRDGPVVSVYLDVDGRRYPRRREYEATLARLLRGARAHPHPGVAEDLHRIETYVRAGVDRSQTRGLALFACSAHRFLETVQLSVPVRNQLVVNHTPHIRQLETVLQRHAFGVLLADRQRVRMFVFEQGELVDRSETLDRLSRADDERGNRDLRGRDADAASAHAHLRRAARVAAAVYRERPFDHLIIDAPSDLDHLLDPHLRDRIAARLTLPASASLAQIRRAALEVDDSIERAREAALVTRFRDHLGATGRAIAGLAGVLGALSGRRVETLLVSDGYVAPGWRCWECDHVAIKGRTCPTCGRDMFAVDDVVEEAVEVALSQSAHVVTCVDSVDLDVHGRIGALVRF